MICLDLLGQKAKMEIRCWYQFVWRREWNWWNSWKWGRRQRRTRRRWDNLDSWPHQHRCGWYFCFSHCDCGWTFPRSNIIGLFQASVWWWYHWTHRCSNKLSGNPQRLEKWKPVMANKLRAYFGVSLCHPLLITGQPMSSLVTLVSKKSCRKIGLKK